MHSHLELSEVGLSALCTPCHLTLSHLCSLLLVPRLSPPPPVQGRTAWWPCPAEAWIWSWEREDREPYPLHPPLRVLLCVCVCFFLSFVCFYKSPVDLVCLFVSN